MTKNHSGPYSSKIFVCEREKDRDRDRGEKERMGIKPGALQIPVNDTREGGKMAI